MQLEKLDHIVLTVRDLQATCKFYTEVLGMTEITFAGSRKALLFGQQKINLHQAGVEFEPKARQPTPGSGDLCFITATPINEAMEHISACGVEIILGPVSRTGATDPITSIYCRDPDQNLIEIANPLIHNGVSTSNQENR